MPPSNVAASLYSANYSCGANPLDEMSVELGACDMSIVYEFDDGEDETAESSRSSSSDDLGPVVHGSLLPPTMPVPFFSDFLSPACNSPWSFAFPPKSKSLQNAGKETKKRVSFAAADATVHPVLHISDYSVEEIAATWITAKEQRESRASIRATIKLSASTGNYSSSSDDDGERRCMRGLECHTPEGSRQKSESKSRARLSLFVEQRNGWNFSQTGGRADADRLARAYSKHTKHCQVLAHMVGLRDEQEARIEDAAARLRQVAMELADATEETADIDVRTNVGDDLLEMVDTNVSNNATHHRPKVFSVVSNERSFVVRSPHVQFTSKAA